MTPCKLPGDAPGQTWWGRAGGHAAAVCLSPGLSPRHGSYPCGQLINPIQSHPGANPGFAPESPTLSDLSASLSLSHALTSQAPVPQRVLLVHQPGTASESPEFNIKAQSLPSEVVLPLGVGRCSGQPHFRQKFDGQA